MEACSWKTAEMLIQAWVAAAANVTVLARMACTERRLLDGAHRSSNGLDNVLGWDRGGVGEANALAAIVKDSVVGSKEDVSQDPEWASGDINAHEAADTLRCVTLSNLRREARQQAAPCTVRVVHA